MYRGIRKKAFLGIMTAFLALQPVTGSAMPDIIPIGEMQEGMSGTAYTVVEQSGAIEPFQVDIVGVVNGGKGSSSMIMAKASGPLIDRTGGVLQGMSGSPVYIDDRLVGAVAMGIKEMDIHTFFITPIEEMLPLWDMPDPKGKIQFKSIDLKKAAEERDKKEKKDGGAAAEKKDADAEAAAETEGTAAKSGAEEKISDGEAAPEQPVTEENDGEEAAAAAETSGETSAEDAAAEKPAEDPLPEELREEAAAETVVPEPETPAEEAAADESEQAVEAAGDQSSASEGSADADAETEQKALFYVSGFTPDSLDFLNTKLPLSEKARFFAGSTPMDAGGNVDYYPVLEPGSPVGVAVMYGDFAMGATGTVTAVEGDRILGFGHEFMHQGNVNYFMTDALVVGTMNGQSSGMKVATLGNIIGRINQDRTAGVAGIIGKFPEVVPVRIHVKDNALGREESYGVRIAYNEELLPQLSAAVAYASLNKVADSLDGSTATVCFTIRTNAVREGTVERTNMFYNPADVGQIAVLELAHVMDLICSNTAEISDVLDIQVDIVLEGGRRTASLISAVPDKLNVKPGDTVNFKTTIKPYRKPEEVLNIPYTVPRTQPEGTLNLDLRGGGMVPVSQLAIFQQLGVTVPSEDGKVPSTEENIKSFLDSGKNNEIIIAPGAVTEVQSESEQKKAVEAAVRAAKEAEKHKVKLLGGAGKKGMSPSNKVETGYIIENVIRSSLQVER